MKRTVMAAVALTALLAGACFHQSKRKPFATPTTTGSVETTTSHPPTITSWPAWQAPDIGDWVWVRVSGETVFASSGPQLQGNSNYFNGPGRVTALDAMTGKERWHFDTRSQPFPVTVAGSLAIFGTADGTVFALDAANGTLSWQHDFAGIPFQVVATKTAIVVGDGDPEAWGPGGIADKTRLAGRVRALDPATGKQRWETNLRNFAVFIAAAGDDVLAVSYSFRGDDDAVLLDRDGKPKWSTSISAVASPPLVAGGAAIVAGSDLRKLDLATGRQVWATPPSNGGTFVGPMVLGDMLVAATNTHTIEAVSLATGSLTASAEFPDCGFQPVEGSPFALVCGGLSRVDLGSQSLPLAPALIPQGRLQSAAFGLGQVFFASTIGDSAPPSVGHVDPSQAKGP